MRELRLINNAIERFKLDLAGLKVFTEAATGYFSWTAVIAALAGAEQVFALAKTSRYATAEEAGNTVLQLAKNCGVSDRIQIVYEYALLGQADIVTNSGAVRPISVDLIQQLKPGAVIPLMWETWEFRDTDLDLSACAKNDVLVFGTNETHPDLRTFDFVGVLAAKLLFEAGLELFGNRILVVGGGEFGASVCRTLNAIGATVGCIALKEDQVTALTDYSICETLGAKEAISFLRKSDGIIFAEHHKENLLIGEDGELNAASLKELNPTLKLAHISGWVDVLDLNTSGFYTTPLHIVQKPRVMSVTTDYVGPKPVLELNVAGLKVGEEMARARRVHPNDLESARKLALQHPFCSDFSSLQIKTYGLYQ
ncbi:MAG: hypothetical protein ACRBF0_21475 [Calditrichia bacterium]